MPSCDEDHISWRDFFNESGADMVVAGFPSHESGAGED
jgi:hypothetical protein